jgi:protein O-GlcNAc transferase
VSETHQPNKNTLLKDVIRNTTCPACAHHVAVQFFNGGNHPLSILAWPQSPTEAQTMERLPLDFVRCIDCGHVYNAQFEYAKVPYSEKPNLMFNSGQMWKEHLQEIVALILKKLPANPVVVEIGCGTGHLLKSLAKERPEGRYIGFEPSGALVSDEKNVESYPILFDPAIHLGEMKPDLIICRHVMEHLKNPLAFLQEIAFAATWEGLSTALFIEVPCIDRVFNTGRTIDFFYEHNSHFTTHSLRRFLSRCSQQVDSVERGYGDEVVYGFSRIGVRLDQLVYAKEAIRFSHQAAKDDDSVQQQFNQLYLTGKKTVIWGGTGKSSTFINRYNLDAHRFPLVVDSDPEKAGSFVPGTGQVIENSDILTPNSLAKASKNEGYSIIVTTQWRAKDIYLEIQRKNIPFHEILIEHQGKLLNYLEDSHPYHPNTVKKEYTQKDEKGEKYSSKPERLGDSIPRVLGETASSSSPPSTQDRPKANRYFKALKQ